MRHTETVLRHGLTALASGVIGHAEWDAIQRTLRQATRRWSPEADHEDLRQAFVMHLLEDRAALDEVLSAPPGQLVAWCRTRLRRFAFESGRHSAAGRLRKAIDDVVRRAKGLFALRGQLVCLVRLGAALGYPVSIWGEGGARDRFDHALLAEAVAAALQAEGPLTRAQLARHLADHYRVSHLPSDESFLEARAANDDEEGTTDAIDAGRVAEQLVLELDARERTILRDVLDERPLREAAPNAGLKVTGVHLARHRLGGKFDRALLAHGLSSRERLLLLRAMDARVREPSPEEAAKKGR